MNTIIILHYIRVWVSKVRAKISELEAFAATGCFSSREGMWASVIAASWVFFSLRLSCSTNEGKHSCNQGWWYQSNRADLSAAHSWCSLLEELDVLGDEDKSWELHSTGRKLSKVQKFKMSFCWIFMIFLGCRLLHASPSTCACNRKLYTLLKDINSSL